VRKTLPDATLTVSLRRAFDDAPESREALFELVEEMWQLGYAAVRVHGRTVEQKYAGRADWSILRELKQRYPQRTIVGSGDVFTAEDAVRMLRETGVDIVWIARGAIGNPWIFEQASRLLSGEAIDPPTIGEQREALREHFALAMEVHGEELAGRRMRKMGIKYARWHPAAREVKGAFIQTASLRDWNAVIDRFYNADGRGVWPAEGAVDEVNATGADGCGIDG
jgi:tRNA-dihydrouridine synthase